MKFDPYIKMCPSREIIKIICDKWTILVINLLAARPYRFGELKREISGISQKMLTQTLLKLRNFGFVSRKPYPDLRLKVEYELTPLGQSLSLQLQKLTAWTLDHMPDIMQAMKRSITN